VIGAARAGVLAARKPQRHAAVGAKLVDQSVSAVAVTEGKQPFGQHFDAHRRAIVLRQLLDPQRGQPIGAKHATHRLAGAGLREEIVLFLAQHLMLSVIGPAAGACANPRSATRALPGASAYAFGDASARRAAVQQHSRPSPSNAISAFFIQVGGRSSGTTSSRRLNTLK